MQEDGCIGCLFSNEFLKRNRTFLEFLHERFFFSTPRKLRMSHTGSFSTKRYDLIIISIHLIAATCKSRDNVLSGCHEMFSINQVSITNGTIFILKYFYITEIYTDAESCLNASNLRLKKFRRIMKQNGCFQVFQILQVQMMRGWKVSKFNAKMKWLLKNVEESLVTIYQVSTSLFDQITMGSKWKKEQRL